MIFTGGKDRFYERLMRQKPDYRRHFAPQKKERDCKHCLYYDERLQKCSQEKCIVFNA